VRSPPEPITIEQPEIVVSAKETTASAVWTDGYGAEYWSRHQAVLQ